MIETQQVSDLKPLNKHSTLYSMKEFISDDVLATRDEILLEKLILVDGQAGCGKSLFSAIVATDFTKFYTRPRSFRLQGSTHFL